MSKIVPEKKSKTEKKIAPVKKTPEVPVKRPRGRPRKKVETKAVAVQSPVPAVNPENLIAQAIEKDVPIQTLEKLLAMRRELKAEWAAEQYFAALAKFQSRCGTIVKTKTVMNRDGTPRFMYAPLDSIVMQVQKLLEEHGFSYTVKTKQEEQTVVAECITHHVDGHQESTDVRMPIESSQYMNLAQQVGTALTYAKRTAFCNGFGIITSDEDVEEIAPEEAGQPREAKKPPRQSEQEKPSETKPEEPEPPKEKKKPGPKPKMTTPPKEKDDAWKKDRRFAGMKPIGFEVVEILKTGKENGSVTEQYVKKTLNRMLLNKGNADFLEGLKDEVEKTIKAKKTGGGKK